MEEKVPRDRLYASRCPIYSHSIHLSPVPVEACILNGTIIAVSGCHLLWDEWQGTIGRRAAMYCKVEMEGTVEPHPTCYHHRASQAPPPRPVPLPWVHLWLGCFHPGSLQT